MVVVKGELIKNVMEFVAKKRGIDGLNSLMDKVNEKEVLFTKESDIEKERNYPPKYYVRVINAALEVLGDENLVREMGRYMGEKSGANFKGIAGRYPPRKSVQYMVIYSRGSFPIFHTGYRTITESSYWIKVSRISRRIYPMVDGFMTYLFEVHGGIREVSREMGDDYVKYVLKF